MSHRQPLPNRRPCELYSFLHGEPGREIEFNGSVGRFDDGRLSEVFLDVTNKASSGLASTCRDAAVLASLALQHGCPAITLRAALTEAEDGSAAGPLGKLLDLALEEERT